MLQKLMAHVHYKWLSLNEYSNKYEVSISTLRRRLRQGQLSYQVKRGKYFLKDVAFAKALATHPAMNTPSTVVTKKPASSTSPPHLPSSIYAKEVVKKAFKLKPPVKKQAPILLKKPLQDGGLAQETSPTQDSYVKILEFQKDFLHKLDKKDQKITFLQEQIGDLQTLVTLLEKENKQLKTLSQKEQTLSKWLDDNP